MRASDLSGCRNTIEGKVKYCGPKSIAEFEPHVFKTRALGRGMTVEILKAKERPCLPKSPPNDSEG